MDPDLIPLWIDLVAVGVGAALGAATAIDDDTGPLAITGVITLAIFTGFGGGIMRDLLLNVRPVAFTSNWYIATALAAVAVTFLFATLVTSIHPATVMLDAAAVGIYACVGVLKAERAGMSALGILLVGVVAATGGSILRDVMLARVPALLRPGHLYATAAFAASLTFYLMGQGGVDVQGRLVVASIVGFGVRMLSEWFGWELGTARPIDTLPTIAGTARRVSARRTGRVGRGSGGDVR